MSTPRMQFISTDDERTNAQPGVVEIDRASVNPPAEPSVSADEPAVDADADMGTDADTVRGPNPYPGPDKLEWTAKFSSALITETGLPAEVAEPLAAYVVQPKRYLQRKGDAFALRPGVLTTLPTGHSVLEVEVHGFTGTPGEFNERIRTAYDSPVRPGARPLFTLPRLITGSSVSGTLAPYLTTDAPVTVKHVSNLLTVMDAALTDADGNRGYRLVEDIELHGQQTTTMHVPLLRRVAEVDGEGNAQERQVLDLIAVKGANRSSARLRLFNLRPQNIVFGVQPRTALNVPVKGGVEKPIGNPKLWVPELARLLKDAYDDPSHPGHSTALRAAKVATVTLQIIVNAPQLSEFHTTVFDPNRIDHRRPPLDYRITEKSASDMRAILRKYREFGLITEDERAWLGGEGPDPYGLAGESAIDARDRRDRALLNVIFPRDAQRRALVREVIGEPTASATQQRHVENRTRMFAATAGDAYGRRFNPRVLEGLYGAKAIKDKRDWEGLPGWSRLLDLADQGDDDALEQFIITRGMLWLAEYELAEADRGSVGAQTEALDEDLDPGDVGAETVRTRRIRRTMANVRDALVADRRRAVALFQELARAVNTSTPPREIGPDGQPVEDTEARRAWFDTSFPKRSTRRNLRAETEAATAAEPDVQQPEPTAMESLPGVRGDLLDVAIDLAKAVETVFLAGARLATLAREAGVSPLPDEQSEATQLLESVTTSVRKDMATLALAVIGFKTEHGAVDAFEDCASAALLAEVAE